MIKVEDKNTGEVKEVTETYFKNHQAQFKVYEKPKRKRAVKRVVGK